MYDEILYVNSLYSIINYDVNHSVYTTSEGITDLSSLNEENKSFYQVWEVSCMKECYNIMYAWTCICNLINAVHYTCPLSRMCTLHTMTKAHWFKFWSLCIFSHHIPWLLKTPFPRLDRSSCVDMFFLRTKKIFERILPHGISRLHVIVFDLAGEN